MLCSISTPTTSSTSNPNHKPSWLDRLHLSKGFAVPSPDLHLDHFLLPPKPNNIPSPPLPPPPPPPRNDLSDPKPAPRGRKKHPPLPFVAAGDDHKQKQPLLQPQPQPQQQQLFDLMSSALAELFVMGGPCPAAMKKKGARKQPSPRACAPSVASASVDEECRDPPATSPPSSADNSIAEANKKKKDVRTKARKKRGAVGGSDELDLSSYSRTEVTVIDSSMHGWKTEKIIFRKGTVWKVRDKKARTLSKKKRKLGLVGKLAGEKEKKQLLGDPKVAALKEPLASIDEGCSYADKRDTSREIDDRILISARRKFARSPRLPVVRNASVSQLQVIAGNKKNGPSDPKVPLNR